MKALMITLGHNSSALFYDGENKPIGYEEERFNRIKNSSAFPKKSIDMIVSRVGGKLRGSKIFISHWFDSFVEHRFSRKYYDYVYMKKLAERYDMELITVDEDFTHHDAHAYSSMAFYNDGATDDQKHAQKHYIVIDGFGNKQEVLSIYRDDHERKPRLMHRVFGYRNSLGLMFQFAATYTGMRGNRDEGKFSGYEIHIDDVVGIEVRKKIEYLASVHKFAYRYNNFNQYDGLRTKNTNAFLEVDNVTISTNDFVDAERYYYALFGKLLNDIGLDEPDEYTKRVVIGFFIQNVVEKVLINIVAMFNMRNVCLSGGVFYNVKLNNVIAKNIPGTISIMPLAGDQGAAIGLYQKHCGQFKFYDLDYGRRNLGVIENKIGLYHFDNDSDFVEHVAKHLSEGFIVNVLQGSLEFGARALGNTSTLALPTERNVKYINTLNGRDTIMPMAPIMLRSVAEEVIEDIDGFENSMDSSKFMGLTFDLKEKYWNNVDFKGIMHDYPKMDNPMKNIRPQIVEDSSETTMARILHKIDGGCLINTSFNTHGSVIPMTVKDAIEEYSKQRKNDYQFKTILVIKTGNEN